LGRTREFSLYIEYDSTKALSAIVAAAREKNFTIQTIEVARPNITKKHNAFALIALREPKDIHQSELVELVKHIEGVVSVERI
jgi:hypothetical protein